MVPGTLDYAQAPKGNSRWFVGYTAESVEKYLDQERPNVFTAQGDGGFVNLAIQNSDRCKFEGKVLKCT